MSEEFVSRNEFNTLKNEVQELKEEVGEYKQLLMQIDKKCDVITEKIAKIWYNVYKIKRKEKSKV